MMYRVENNVPPIIVSDFFYFSNVSYSLRSGSHFHQPSANTVWDGEETISS